jgi:hypothetical protein
MSPATERRSTTPPPDFTRYKLLEIARTASSSLYPSLPVATSLQADEPAMPRVGKVARDQERRLRLGPLNHARPRLHRLRRIHIEGKYPVRLGYLRRIDRDIPDEQGRWCPSTPVIGKLATMDTICSSFRPCCLVSASACSTGHQRGDTDSFQLVILLTVTARQSGDLRPL